MQRKESTFSNMIIALIVITLGSGLILGLVNDWTLEPKAKAKLNQKISAIEMVLSEFDNNPIEDVIIVKPELYTDSIEVYPAFKNEAFIGAAVTGYSDRGYSGLVKLMVGFNNDGAIENIAVLEQKETPGLGTKMKNQSFIAQFRNKNPETFNIEVSKDGGDVDAITGATISTRAFTEAVQMAFDEFVKYKQTNSDKI